MGERGQFGPWPFAFAGGVVGVLLSLAACGELDWFLESRSPTEGDESPSIR
jgi:hypothetical protein